MDGWEGAGLSSACRWNLDQVASRAFGVFATVLELEPENRERFVDEACAGDGDLRAEVLRLLSLHNEVEHRGFLSDPLQLTVKSFMGDPLIGEMIGHYKIEAVLGEGAMGRVYLAEQDRPRRKVALKMIHPHVMAPALRKRFDFETQVLGRLQHAGIARIYDAGFAQTAAGSQPFFAMEFIEGGRPLTEYVRETGLNTRERLELFLRVCDAVHYAHQQGVIHRDLKPDNILVDAHGVPRILDFGIARATERDTRTTTMHTSVGQLIGTLQYMSPEQCGDAPDTVDTRSDVYALGVLLYELISGQLPYDIRRCGLTEAIGVIRESAPTRLSSWDRRLSGDLETIVQKSLEKEPERRYGSAEQLGDDIRRFLKHQAIVARPPSLTYQLRVLARRNRAFFGATVSIFLTVAAGFVVSTTLYIRAARARGKAETVSRFLQQIFSSIDPEIAQGRDVSLLRKVLDESARRIETEVGSEPELESELRITIGDAYNRIGVLDAAEANLRTALQLRQEHSPRDEAAIASTLSALGRFLCESKQEYQEGVELLRSSVSIRRRSGNEDPTLATDLHALGYCIAGTDRHGESAALLKEAFAIRENVLGRHHAATADTLRLLGWTNNNDQVAAEGCLREALEIGRGLPEPQSRLVELTLRQLSVVLQNIGKTSEGVALSREALAIDEKLFGKEHHLYATGMAYLAGALHAAGQDVEAERLCQDSIQLHQRLLGAETRNSMFAFRILSRLVHARGDLSAAEQLYRDRLAKEIRFFGERQPMTTKARVELAELLRDKGEVEQSEALLSVALQNAKESNDAKRICAGLLVRAGLLRQKGDYVNARKVAMDAAKLTAGVSGEGSPAEWVAQTEVAMADLELGNVDQAERLSREISDSSRQVLGDLHPISIACVETLSIVLEAAGRFQEAEQLLAEVLADDRRTKELRHPDRLLLMGRLASILDKLGRPDEAVRLAEAAVESAKAELSPEHWYIAKLQVVLGSVMSHQGRLAEAERLLRDAHTRLVALVGAGHEQARAAEQAFKEVRETSGWSLGSVPSSLD